MTGSRKDWFLTPIWHFSIDKHQQLNIILLEEFVTEQKRDRQGEKWSNVLSWHNVNHLHKRDSFYEFTQIIHQNVLELASNSVHGVEMNMSDRLRVCLSFNIGMSPLKN
jgi:hypothetical protein